MIVPRTLRLPAERSLFLFGPRQTGKSTLIAETYARPSCLFYDLLNSEDFRRLSARPETLRREILAAAELKEVKHVIVDCIASMKKEYKPNEEDTYHT
ncbi:MAG: hypothetical protein GF344_19065 [Chitinivibrionales bacterium]|nr:hypothetical protein [Chitinivibrionales bacterium]MBD3358728.1 hypothetical protein [Chitinivibrionales bacterium]